MKKIWVVLITIILIAVGFLYVKNPASQSNNSKPAESVKEKITVYQKIASNDTGVVSYERHEVEKGKTALDLLQRTAKVTIKDSGPNAFVTAINGLQANDKDKKYWAFYVNGTLAEVGAGSYQLKNNDKIEWKLASY